MPLPGRFAAVTIAPRSHLGHARATAASCLTFNPDLPFHIVVADAMTGLEPLRADPFILVAGESLDVPEPKRFRFQYTELEHTYALTPFAIAHLLAQGFDGVLFLKLETLVLDDLTPVLARLADHSVLLTPHFLAPPGTKDAVTREADVLRAGVFNGGFLAFSGCPETDAFLAWWQARMSRFCLRDAARGLHFEQRWLDLAPGAMPRHLILRDPGVNVGHWNLPERDIRIRRGKVTARSEPCRVFRFSGYDVEKPHQVTRYNTGYTVESTGDAAEVFERYARMVRNAGYHQFKNFNYAWGRYDDGTAVADADRITYRRLGDAVRDFGDPFRTSGENSFRHWLEARKAEAAQ